MLSAAVQLVDTRKHALRAVNDLESRRIADVGVVRDEHACRQDTFENRVPPALDSERSCELGPDYGCQCTTGCGEATKLPYHSYELGNGGRFSI